MEMLEPRSDPDLRVATLPRSLTAAHGNRRNARSRCTSSCHDLPAGPRPEASVSVHSSRAVLGRLERSDAGLRPCQRVRTSRRAGDMVSCWRCLTGLRRTCSGDSTGCARSVPSRSPKNGRRAPARTTTAVNSSPSWPGTATCTSTPVVAIATRTLRTGDFIRPENIDITILTVGTDLRLDNPPCQVCGSFGTEVHWAPSAVFGQESALWPRTHLCRDCHAEWHRRMEEYYLARPPQLFRREA